MEFKYKALNKEGKVEKGLMEAEGIKEVKGRLQEDGLKMMEVKQRTESTLGKVWKQADDKFQGLVEGERQKKRRKKQWKSLEDELDIMGYSESEKRKSLRKLRYDTFTMDEVEEMFELTEIQRRKVEAGKIHRRKEEEREGIYKILDYLPSFKRKVPKSDIVKFTDRLALMLENDMDMISALKNLRIGIGNEYLGDAIDECMYELSKGRSFSEALSKNDDIFPDIYISMVQVGEESGSDLSKALYDLVEFLDMDDRIQREVKKGSNYPIFIGGLMVVVVYAMSVLFVPRMEKVFGSYDFELPLLSQIVFGIADYIGIVMLLLFGVVASVIASYQKIPYTRNIMIRARDTLVYKLPVLKELAVYMQMYQSSLILYITVKNGLGITDGLMLLRQVVGNRHLKKDITGVIQDLEKGKDIPSAFEDKRYFTVDFKAAVRAGDASGRLDKTLDSVSRSYKRDLDDRLEEVQSMIPSVFIVLIGLLVGPFVIGMLLPMTSMTEQLQNMNR